MGRCWSQWVPKVLDFTLTFTHFSNLCVFCSHKLQAVSLSTLSIASCSPPPLSPPPLFHSGSLLMDHGPLGPSTYSGLLLPCSTDGSGLSDPGLCWIIALLCFTISSYLYFCNSWYLSLSISNYLVWPALFQLTEVNRRFCGLATTWWCLDPLTLHIICIRHSVTELVNCDLLLFSVHVTSVACLSVLEEGSLHCGSSWGFFDYYYFFFTLLKESFFSINMASFSPFALRV